MVRKTGHDAQTVTVRVDHKEREAAQQAQIERIKYKFMGYLTKTRGWKEARAWGRNIDQLLRTEGTTYDDIRRHLEWSLNTYLRSVEQDLRDIIAM